MTKYNPITIALAALLVAGSVHASDEEGRAAVKGAGAASCADFVKERKAESRLYYMFGGWINGYVTAYNQTTADTFDIVPWQSTDLLAGMLDGHCKKNPDQPFIYAVNAMLQSLKGQRLTEKSEVVEVSSGDHSVAIYEAMLRRVQSRLAERDHYNGSVDGVFGPKTAAAIRAYQQAQQLPQTGVPDQKTLVVLMLLDK